MHKDCYLKMVWDETLPDLFTLLGWVLAICIPPALVHLSETTLLTIL